MGMFDKIKDLSAMRQQAKQLQIQLAAEQISGESRDHLIRLTMDGNQDVKSVEVKEGIEGDRKRIAQDIREALSDMNNNYKKMMAKKFGHMAQ